MTRDPRVRPRPQEARLVRPAGHRVVPGAEAAADDDRELRDLGAGDGGHHLRAVLRDPAGLVLAADHEAGDVLEEDQRDLALRGELDEVGALERRRAEQDAVVGDDPDRVAVDVGEAGDERLAVARLEVVEAAAVDEPGDDLADLDGPARVGRDGAVEAGRVDRRRLRRGPIPGRRRRPPVQVADDRPAERERVLVVEREVVGDAGGRRVEVAAAEVLGA